MTIETMFPVHEKDDDKTTWVIFRGVRGTVRRLIFAAKREDRKGGGDRIFVEAQWDSAYKFLPNSSEATEEAGAVVAVPLHAVQYAEK